MVSKFWGATAGVTEVFEYFTIYISLFLLVVQRPRNNSQYSDMEHVSVMLDFHL